MPASRLAAISARPTIREFAQGAAQRATQPVADFLAPTVQVPTSTGRYKVYTEKHRFKVPNTLRGIGGRAAELSFDASDATYNCEPHALDFPVDRLEELEESSMESALQEGAQMIAEVAALAHEKSVLEKAIVAASAASAVTAWTATNGDPVNDLDTDILTVIKNAKYGSLMGVGVILGATAFQLLKNHTVVRARFVTNTKGAGNVVGALTPDIAGALLLGQPETRLSLMVEDTAAEGKTASMSFLLDKGYMVFARMANPTRRDPSFMKTFRLAGQWMVPGSYVRDDDRVEVAKFDWSEHVVVTNSTAGIYRVVSA